LRWRWLKEPTDKAESVFGQLAETSSDAGDEIRVAVARADGSRILYQRKMYADSIDA
jgi:hypothetical protein